MAKLQQQTDKIKARCLKEFPDDRKQRKNCLQVHKAKWINSMKVESVSVEDQIDKMMESGMTERIPSGGIACDSPIDGMNSDEEEIGQAYEDDEYAEGL